ncbi:hypothetical protein AQUCO_01100320v1 [Aquilegia coerulea]|uniref:Glycosyltransferase family 92 protein n=1 Tax=Aquilegia coerulea TaxID=218851 RepID=A0A2G5E6M7_AQUCA|nr:hypothetical protein AQUCO_01100320v1 [Aquilegia coerulea]
MKDRRRREVVSISWSRFFCFTIFVVFSCVLFTGFTFSSFRLFGETFRPVLISSWRNSAMEAISDDSTVSPSIEIRETVIFPDQFVLFLYYPSSFPLFTKDDLHCSYFHPNSTQPELKLPPVWIDIQNPNHQIIRCPVSSTGVVTSLSLKSKGHLPSTPTPASWDFLVYEAVLDRDNTTIIFVKGLNLRPDRLADSSRYECVYGWDFEKPRLLLTSEVISAAQEIVRCKTPLSVLSSLNKSIKVSVKVKRRGILHSVARLDYRLESDSGDQKKYEMCVCTMVRNQARFLREWVMYHARIGVQRWFIYDNNSEDAIDEVIESLERSGYRITRHVWLWIKTQEAGFAHCALRARQSCEWVGFFDVDEFLHFPSGISLQNVLRNKTFGFDQLGELRISCHSYGTIRA